MESEAKYALVGTVVLILLAAMLTAIVWLRSASGLADEKGYKIYFGRQSLDGVQLRSDVKMKGIVVGAVTGFRISIWRQGSVEVLIRIDESTPVRQSTKAVVERQLLTGIASIRLVNESEDSPLLTQAPDAEPYPVIAEGESELEQFSNSIAQLAAKADDTLKRANALMSEENRAAFSQTLDNVRRITASAERGMQGLDGTLAGLDSTLISVSQAADQVQSLAVDLSAGTGKLSSRYDDLGQEAIAVVRDVRASVRDVRVSIDRMAADVARLTGRADVLLADGSAEFGNTAQALQSAADSLGMAARQFRDPRAILLGPAAGELGPGESRR